MEAVVAIDAAVVGHSRQLYFQRRLKAALEQTDRHVQFSAESDGRLVGFIKARKQLGEFGRAAPAMLLEAVAVASGAHRQGIGSALLDRLESEARRLGVPEIRTTASWRDHAILQFLDHAGFRLSQNTVLECVVSGSRVIAHEGDRILAPAHVTGFSTTEVDYGGSAANDFDTLAASRIEVRLLPARRSRRHRAHRSSGHRAPARRLHPRGGRRSDQRRRREVSLVASLDGVAAGFVTARADFGDYGRVEPVAVLDTIGVDPDYAHRGVGRALLAQLFANLGALGVDRVETVVAREDFGLLGYFYRCRFPPGAAPDARETAGLISGRAHRARAVQRASAALGLRCPGKARASVRK